MQAEVFEISTGQWGYRVDGIFQEYYPGIEGFVPMTREQAEYFSQSTTSTTEEVISVTRAQAKLALLQFNRLHQIEQFIENLEESILKETLRIEWNDRLTFESNNQILLQLASQLLIPNEELKSIFRLASTL